MLNKIFRKKQEENLLDKEIERVIEEMAHLDPSSDEYQTAMKTLNNFYELKFKEEQGKHKRGVSPDTKAIVIGNLLGIALILSYEHAHVVTSKALGFVLRGRV